MKIIKPDFTPGHTLALSELDELLDATIEVLDWMDHLEEDTGISSPPKGKLVQALQKVGCQFSSLPTLLELNLSIRAYNRLIYVAENEGYGPDDPVVWLVDYPVRELLKLRGLGKVTLKEIVNTCEKKGIPIKLPDERLLDIDREL